MHRTQRDLIAILEEADKQPEFHRFMGMSPELRDMVYRFSFQNNNPTDLSRVCPKTPAICRLNHETRDETLPIFFRTTRLSIVVSAKPGRSKPMPQGRSTRTQTAEIHEKFQEYFLPAEKKGWLQHMRHFQWRLMGKTFNGNSNDIIGKDWDDRFFVDFSNNMQTVATWRKEKDRESRLEGVQAKMATTTNRESVNMTPSAFDCMMAIFMDSVVKSSS
jgi:hypothetical protein